MRNSDLRVGGPSLPPDMPEGFGSSIATAPHILGYGLARALRPDVLSLDSQHAGLPEMRGGELESARFCQACA